MKRFLINSKIIKKEEKVVLLLIIFTFSFLRTTL